MPSKKQVIALYAPHGDIEGKVILNHLTEKFGYEIVDFMQSENLDLLRDGLRERRKAGKKILVIGFRTAEEYGLLKDNDAFVMLAGVAGNNNLVQCDAHILAGSSIDSIRSQINSILSNRNRILLCSDSPDKISEYRQLFARHSIAIETAPKEIFDNPVLLAQKVSDPASRISLVLRDTNILCAPDTGLPLHSPEDRSHHGMSADNICFLDLRHIDAEGRVGAIEKRQSRISGWIDNAIMHQANDVFGWDEIFRNGATGLSNHQMRQRGLKVSARDLLLSQIIIEFFYPATRADLKQTPLSPANDLPFEISPVDFFLQNRIVQQSCPEGSPLRNAFHAAMRNGVYVKAQSSRRAGNYFNTNLNGGMPLVPKRDPVQELNYMAHDLMHHLIKEPVFIGVPKGENIQLWRAVYCFCLKMSESNAQVLIDMLFADATIKSGVNYDYGKRPTYPLFKQLVPPTGQWDKESLFALFEANARFEIFGDDTGFKAMFNPQLGDDAEQALSTFKKQYSRTFAVDWQWIGSNFNNMHNRNGVFMDWADQVGNERFTAAGLVTLKDYVQALPDDFKAKVNTEGASIQKLYDVIVPKMINAVLDCMCTTETEPSRHEVIGAGFRRWALGQSLLFSTYDFHPAVAARSASFLEMLDVSNTELVSRIGNIRTTYRDVLLTLSKAGLITADDERTYQTNFPFFDPNFMYNKALGKPEEDIAEAAALFGQVTPASGLPVRSPVSPFASSRLVTSNA